MVTLGFLSTYPPTLCGLASFTAALRAALPEGVAGGVVRLVDADGAPWPDGVVGELVAGSPASCRAAAGQLNRQDVAVVQHEYGIYGGRDGDDVLRVLALLSVPAIVVLHTVLSTPTAHQRFVLDGVVAAAAAVVVMSETARSRLVNGYDVPAHRVVVVPHGAPDAETAPAIENDDPSKAGPSNDHRGNDGPSNGDRDRGNDGPSNDGPSNDGRGQILTWGLLGPGKGIEWGIEAMALLGDLLPEPRYVVAGRTHPKVLAHQGEHYRRALVSRAGALGVHGRVRFDARYLDVKSLQALVARTQVVLLPYDSRDQVTSGVLVEAVTARIPVVATRFPHAVELLADGAGVLVDHQDPPAIAKAVRMILTDRGAAAGMTAAAGVAARSLGWRAVADQYRQLAERLTRLATAVVA